MAKSKPFSWPYGRLIKTLIFSFRFGTPPLTTRGIKDDDIKKVTEYIDKGQRRRNQIRGNSMRKSLWKKEMALGIIRNNFKSLNIKSRLTILYFSYFEKSLNL